MVCWSGCGSPGGGIRRPRSLRTAFSQVSASEGMSSGDMVSKATPPAQSSLLWHFSQRFFNSPQSGGSSVLAAQVNPVAISMTLARIRDTLARFLRCSPKIGFPSQAGLRRLAEDVFCLNILSMLWISAHAATFTEGVWDPAREKKAPPRPRGGRSKAENRLIMEV